MCVVTTWPRLSFVFVCSRGNEKNKKYSWNWIQKTI